MLESPHMTRRPLRIFETPTGWFRVAAGPPREQFCRACEARRVSDLRRRASQALQPTDRGDRVCTETRHGARPGLWLLEANNPEKVGRRVPRVGCIQPVPSPPSITRVSSTEPVTLDPRFSSRWSTAEWSTTARVDRPSQILHGLRPPTIWIDPPHAATFRHSSAQRRHASAHRLQCSAWCLAHSAAQRSHASAQTRQTAAARTEPRLM